ncbi:MAG: glycoside hydrolase family 3 C-terminal domain-containing protein [Odoribacteraceae bacterium]|jgi:beta-glucosidase|nr:glycoside hydrolase family 3 C-terminal domain-containing protein [Odoribacteraceae bacterium]
MKTRLLFLLLLVSVAACKSSLPPSLDTRVDFEKRVDDLVARMNLQQKIDQLRYDAPGIDSLGIPPHNWWNEGLHGVARDGIATVFPQAIGLAATWDEEFLYLVGDVISTEARVKHREHAERGERDIYQGLSFWSPNINIFRDPRWGRGMETYGEDPFLTGSLAVQFIRGLQGDDPRYLKVISGVKHFAVHSGPESTRHSFDARPSMHDMLETYLPHFERAVKEGGARCVMCAYQRLDGMPCCGNAFLEAKLRGEWGFTGYIVSDCWALHDFYREGRHGVATDRVEAAAMAIKAGVDQNCGDTYPALGEAVERGLVTEEEIDRAVKRIMLARMQLGQFDPDSIVYARVARDAEDIVYHDQFALQVAMASIVLLKNEGNLLPLDKMPGKIAVIGPNADDEHLLYGNYNGFAENYTTPLEGIREMYSESVVAYAPGCPVADGLPLLRPVPGDCLYTDSSLSEHGLRAVNRRGEELKSPRHGEERWLGVDVHWGREPPDGEHFDGAISWTGVLVPRVTGDYAIGGHAYPRFELYLDDKRVAGWNTVHETNPALATLRLEAGRHYRLRLEYTGKEGMTGAFARLLWDPPAERLEEEAIEVARDADVVIMCMGLSPRLEGEEMRVNVEGFRGGDRVDIGLPRVQQELIRKIHALGKPIILVLLNGSALAIPWEAEHVPAIVEAWYPGQEGGRALALALSGIRNPSGRLPVTFYKSAEDLPPFDDYDMRGRTYRYFEGEPLFPFGHGLSYTRFAYTGIEAPDKIRAGEPLTVSVKVENTGDRDGNEVVQLYVTRENAPGRVPIRSLQGFARVYIYAGETCNVEFTLSPRQLARVDGDHLVTDAGVIRLSVGGGQPSAALLESGGAIEKRVVLY